MDKSEAIAISPSPAWRDGAAALPRLPRHVLLSGSIIMLAGSTAVSGVNFLYNVTLARLLGPAEFGHATAAVTLLMLASAITLSFQLVCAKFVARNESEGARAAVYTALRRRAWLVGVLVGGTLAVFSAQIGRAHV